MAQNFTKYDTTTGKILAVYTAKDEAAALLNCGDGEAMIEGTGDWDTQLVKNGKLVAMPTAEIDAIESAKLSEQIRSKRDSILARTDIDLVKLLETYDSFDDYKAARANLKAYRQALRDLPQQSDFPHNAVWPTLGGTV